MLRFISDPLKTKNMCKDAIEKLPLVIKYVSYQYKTQESCDKAILENGWMLHFMLQNCVVKLSKIMPTH